MNEENKVYRLEQMLLAIESLNYKCENNMRRLNDMMLELKGIVAMVRPMAAKNDWYNNEIQSNVTVVANDPKDQHIADQMTNLYKAKFIEHQQ